MDADVIVIGAGAAGLNAARKLAERSLRTIVLEARDRIGGRVLWKLVPGLPSPAELGGEYIHGAAPETFELLEAAGCGAQPLADESWSFRDGRLQRDSNDFSTWAALFERASSLEPDVSVNEFLAQFAGDPAMRDDVELARAFVEGFDAADPAIASVRSIAQEWASGTDETAARPRGGYRAMFGYLHRACEAAGADVRLSTTVARITWRRGEVTVNGLRARAAIVTVPIGTLNEIAFDPALPASKEDALHYLATGNVVKVAMWFRTPFWERADGGRYRDSGFFRRGGAPFVAFWTQVPERSRLIVAWAGGPKADALRGVVKSALIELAARTFGAMFGMEATSLRELEGAEVHDWANDPFAGGAYSFVRVGGAHARASLAQPLDDTLFFAGEATSTNGQGGTVNGALASGARAAAEASCALGAKST